MIMAGGEELRSILSVNIKQLRDRLGLSQAMLAERAGISITFLSAIEREKKWPYPETLTNIADALGVDVHELFKPKEETISNEVVTAINKCLDDVSLSIRQNINKAILQSVENIREYYTRGIGEQSGGNSIKT
jgi:transcriptional regulator with XRE-family HTH domain